MDNTRVINSINKDKGIKLYEYDKLIRYFLDDEVRIVVAKDRVSDDFYLCDCIYELEELQFII